MMYPFMTLDDDTEITHSEMQADGSVKVYIETPDEKDGFHDATCFLPEYRWEAVHGYSEKELERFREMMRNNAHLILEFAQKGGVLHAAKFFRIGPYIIYFWSNENDPLEPLHIHIAEGRASANGTKVWITSKGKTLLCNNSAKIPAPILRNLLRVVEANSDVIEEKWIAHFGQISYYC